jgi:ferredoxin
MEASNRIAVTVVSGGKKEEFFVNVGENLLMAMVRANLPIDFFCTTGKCTTCRLRMQIPEGSAMPPGETERYRLGKQLIAAGYRLACQVRVDGPLTVFLDRQDVEEYN